MAGRRVELLDEELARAVTVARVPRESLEGLFRGESAGVAPSPWGEPEILKSLGRLLVAAAEELEAVVAHQGPIETARGGLLGLSVVASLLEVPRLAEWSSRLAVSDELPGQAANAARMLRGEAFEMVFTQSLVELRECQWRLPEGQAEEAEVAETVAAIEAAPEPVREAPPAPEPEPVVEPPKAAEPEPVREPEPEPVPEPAPEPKRVAPPPAPPVARAAFAPRALVADSSAIAAGFLARLLMSRGIAVTLAESAERAAAELGRGGFEIAFVDEEWPLPANVHGALIVRLFGEGANPRVGLGERFLLKPPAQEEVNQILAAWSGRQTPHAE